MPQTIQGKQLNTVTLAANDLATVNFAGGGADRTFQITNYGPGKVMISNNKNVIPSMSSTDCLLLDIKSKHEVGPVSGAISLLLISDTAAAIVTFSFL